MEITGKVHCLFEQSGTFKNEFKKLGFDAEDYDIQNNFGETDHVVDLFHEIEQAYDDKPSIFDNMSGGADFVIAFFPCIHFCDMSTMNLHLEALVNNGFERRRAYSLLIKRHQERDSFFALLTKMLCVADTRGLRMVFENPYNGQTYLKSILRKPDVLDSNRMLRGDFFIKPTGYWFINCSPTYGMSIQNDKPKLKVWAKNKKIVQNSLMKGVKGFAAASPQEGICSEERSMISPDYARNFICDFIIGKKQKNTQLDLFD